MSKITDLKLLRQNLPDCFVFLSILAVGLIYTFGLEQILDIGLYDESNYLHGGLLIPQIFPAPQNAPLYSLWYAFLSLFQSDPVRLYFLNYKLLTAIPSLILFLTLRSFSVPRIVSLSASLFLMVTHINVPTWPKVSHFTVMIILFGFHLSSFFRSRHGQIAVLVLTTFAVSYVRPEFFLAWVSLSILFTVTAFYEYRKTLSLKGAKLLIACLLLSVGVLHVAGVPLGSGKRSMIAFGQHFSRHWVQWQNDRRNPWTNWESIVQENFGDVTSPMQAFLANPEIVARHIIENVCLLPWEMKTGFGSFYPSTSLVNYGFMLVFLLLILSIIYPRKYAGITVLRERLNCNWNDHGYLLTLLSIMILPVIISILLIAPRQHYLYILGMLLVLGLSILFFRNTEEKHSPMSVVLLTLVCITALTVVRPLPTSFPRHSQPILKTIQRIRQLDATIPVNLLDADGGYAFYSGKGYTYIPQYDMQSGFLEFMKTRGVNMIVVTWELCSDVRFKNDPEWVALVNTPELFGFSWVSIPDVTGRDLLIKNDVLPFLKLEDPVDQ